LTTSEATEAEETRLHDLAEDGEGADTSGAAGEPGAGTSE
jgi:hypothetical protein